jgi:hypothetical protein
MEYSMQLFLDMIEMQTHKQAKDIFKNHLEFVIKAYFLDRDQYESQKPRLLYLMQRLSFHFNLNTFLHHLIEGFRYDD